MRRRDLLKLAALRAVAPVMATAGPQFTQSENLAGAAIDTHIHLFDTLRPGGVPWPEKTDMALYKPALPDRFIGQSAHFGIVGAIAIECSPLKSDNQWLLNVAADHSVIVGVIGDLIPDAPDYLDDLDRLRQNPLFLGIRYGNLWNRDLAADLDKPGFLDGLKALAAAGLVLDSANPDPRLIGAIRRVSESVPDLRIVIDHLPHAVVPAEPGAHDAYWADLRALAQNPHVFVKLSEIPVRTNGRLVTDPHAYREPLDAIWDLFGEDHVLFGSDWPNSDHVASYAQTFAIVRGCVMHKSPAAQEKYFWKNSLAAYRWKKRRPDQPTA
ncbi:MAG TPA: amidohydrolase family protein [Terracidiphilus sp.]|nr:amidohydrolase family protein [Terracidiphilus sp.]